MNQSRPTVPATRPVFALSWLPRIWFPDDELQEASDAIFALTGKSARYRTVPTPHQEGYTVLVSAEPLSDDDRTWIREHWGEAVQRPSRLREFRVPMTSPPPVAPAFRVKPEARVFPGAMTGQLIQLLSCVVCRREEVVEICARVDPAFTAHVRFGASAHHAWFKAFQRAIDVCPASPVLDRIVTAVFNERADEGQRKQLLAYLDPA